MLVNNIFANCPSAAWAIFPEDKRHFNLQGTLRNRFFLEIQSILQSKNIPLDDLIVEKFNYDQLLISGASLKKTKITPCEKCIQADSAIIDLYKSIKKLKMMNSLLETHVEKIKEALLKNELYLQKFPIQA